MPDQKTSAATKPAAPATFPCPQCGKRFRWKPELAGRKFRCSGCGAVAPAPASPAAANGAEAGAAKPGARRGPGSGVDLDALAARGGFVAPRQHKIAVEETEEMTALHNWVVPLIALGAALLWRVTQVLASEVPMVQAVGLVLGEWVLISAGIAAGTLGAMTVLGIELGRIVPGLLKVGATALLMASVAHFARGFDIGMADWIGLHLAILCVVLLGFFMFAAMFRADLLEGLGGTVMVTIGAVVAMLVLGAVVDGPARAVLALGSKGAGF